MLNKTIRFVSSTLMIIFSLNAFSSIGSLQELSNERDNYEYQMTVEWEQKDEVFFNEKTQFFLGNISKENIVSMIQQRTGNSNIIQDLEHIIS
jgi:uncharacterized membrane protein